jgi:hypothetical protein
MDQAEIIQLMELMRLELILTGSPLGTKVSEVIATGLPSKNTYAHKTYSKIIMRHILGMSVKDYRELHGLNNTTEARASLSIEQLSEVHKVELQVAKVVEEVGSTVPSGELKLRVRKVLQSNRY